MFKQILIHQNKVIISYNNENEKYLYVVFLECIGV